MLDENLIIIAKLRLNKAEATLKSSHDNIYILNDLETAVNRSYYAIFYAMKAVLTLENFDSKKHSGIISQFRKNYISTGLLPVSLSKIIDKLFITRTNGDYDDFFEISREEVVEQYENAELFITEIKKYLLSIFNSGGAGITEAPNDNPLGGIRNEK